MRNITEYLGWSWREQRITTELEARIANDLKLKLSNLRSYSVWLAEDLKFTDELLYRITIEEWSDQESIFILDDGKLLKRLDGNVPKFYEWFKGCLLYTSDADDE